MLFFMRYIALPRHVARKLDVLNKSTFVSFGSASPRKTLSRDYAQSFVSVLAVFWGQGLVSRELLAVPPNDLLANRRLRTFCQMRTYLMWDDEFCG